MKLIKPSFEIIKQPEGISGIYKQIEKAGRTCYKSEDKITEDSAIKFVDRLTKSGHGAMLEHGTVYLSSNRDFNAWSTLIEHFSKNKYSIVKNGLADYDVYVTTNYRVLVENNLLDDLKYLCEPTEFHERRVTVKFICNRQVSHEFVRHRVFSFAQESTRYCNYTKDKFNKQLIFIIPNWIDIPEGEAYWHDGINFRIGATEENDFFRISVNPHNMPVDKVDMLSALLRTFKTTEETYFNLIKSYGWQPQQIATILPNATKTELIMTGFISDWKHFFELRCDSAAHPQAQELAKPLMEEFINRNYI